MKPRVLENYQTLLNNLPSNWIGNGFEGLHNLPPNVLKKYPPKCTELLQYLSEMEPRAPKITKHSGTNCSKIKSETGLQARPLKGRGGRHQKCAKGKPFGDHFWSKVVKMTAEDVKENRQRKSMWKWYKKVPKMMSKQSQKSMFCHVEIIKRKTF